MPNKVYGEIPGVPVGTNFDSRAALAAAGVHKPLMSGISGSSQEAADSIVISGGYEDDEDLGREIIYTGQGGNDPFKKKQIANQQLKLGNLGLLKSYIEGLPVRVIRGANHKSPYSPPHGYTYDGLFNVVDYWSETGLSGFKVWRFRLQQVDLDGSFTLDGSTTTEQDLDGVDAPPKVNVVLQSRIIRNTVVALQVKEMHDYQCQFCGVRLETPGGPYAEAAHVKPLGKPHNGPDVIANILCLCPNHHTLFDFGAVGVRDDLSLINLSGDLRVAKGHVIDSKHLGYHRSLYSLD